VYYHIELRQFPHNMCRFNLNERELGALVESWTREPWVELGERKWSPHHAKLKILEGPEMPLEQLSMGRGWRAAERTSKDVTERVLAGAKEVESAGSEDSPQHSTPDTALLADSLGLELLALLGEGPAPLSQAWRLAGARFPERSPSECLALAEQAVRSLLRGRLIVLLHAAPQGTHVHGDSRRDGEEMGEAEVEPVLRALDSWAEQAEAAGIRMRRA
jgi:hypothetical protein